MGQGPTMHWEQGQTGAWALFCPQSPCETAEHGSPCPHPRLRLQHCLHLGAESGVGEGLWPNDVGASPAGVLLHL